MRLSLNKPLTRRTRERELIMDQLQSLPGHFSADNLLFSLARQGKRVSRATVYRTLDLLVDRGVLQRVHLGEGGAEYELMEGRPLHAHLYCLGCGKLMDYALPWLAQLPARVRRREGFQMEHLLLRICGYCKRCRGRRSKKGPARAGHRLTMQ